MIRIIALVLVLSSCGGKAYQNITYENTDYCADDIDFLVSFCEAQGGEAQYLDIFNETTGASCTDVYCYVEPVRRAACKPDNGLGQECPEI